MTTSYATWNPSDKGSGVTLSNGNLTGSTNANNSVRSTVGVSNGKWYWEVHYDSAYIPLIGIATASATVASTGGAYPGIDNYGWSYYGYDGHKYHGGVSTAYGAAYSPGDVIGIALDMDAGTITFYKNGVLQGMAFTGLAGTVYAMFGGSTNTGTNGSQAVVTANFGATAFVYPPPTGFNSGLFTATSFGGDPNYQQVSLLLHGRGPNGGVSIIDSSPLPKTVTPHGSAAISTARSAFESSSMLFNGTTDYLSVPSTGMYPAALANDDFTVEALVYITAYGSAIMRVAGFSDSAGATEVWSLNITTNGSPSFAIYDTDYRAASTTDVIPLNTWTHIAGVKSGANVYVFCAGKLGATSGVLTSAIPGPGAGLLGVGRMGDYNGQYFAGNICDFRITKTARYTGNFTPPRGAFPDNVGQVGGTVKDDTGAAAGRLVRGYRRADGAKVSDAYSGVGDPAFYSTVLLVHGFGVTTTQASYYDTSIFARQLTPNGPVTLNSAQTKYGGSSIYFPGGGSYLSVATSSDFQIFGADFTIELWANFPSTVGNQPFIELYSGINTRANISVIDGYVYFFSMANGTGGSKIKSTTTPSVNTWHHIALTRLGGTFTLWVDGVSNGTSADLANLPTGNQAVSIGSVKPSQGSGGQEYIGYLSDVRITKGNARYNGAFTPPNDRLPEKFSGNVGDYSFWTPTLDELSVICLDDTAGTVYDDLIARVVPG